MSKRQKKCPNGGDGLPTEEDSRILTLQKPEQPSENSSSLQLRKTKQKKDTQPPEEPQNENRWWEEWRETDAVIWQESRAAYTGQTPSHPEKISKQKKKRKIRKVIVFLIILILIAAAVVILAFLLNRADRDASNDSDYEEESLEEETALPEETNLTLEIPATDIIGDVPTETVTPDPEEEMDGEVITPLEDIVYTTEVGVPLREGPSTSYDTAQTLTKGVELQRTGTTGTGWSLVIYEGKTYYVSEDLITESISEEADDSIAAAAADSILDEPAEFIETVTVISQANARSGPAVNYSVVAVLPAGTTLQRVGTTGNWSQVIYQGQTAYVNNNLLNAEDASTSISLTLTVISEANIRSGPGTNYIVLGTVLEGTTLDAVSLTVSNWYEVKYAGQTGYIAANMVTVN